MNPIRDNMKYKVVVMSRDSYWRCFASNTGTLSIKLLEKFVIFPDFERKLSLYEMSCILPYHNSLKMLALKRILSKIK